MSVSVSIQDNYILIATPYSMYKDVKAIKGGIWNKKNKVWKFHLTPVTAKQVHATFRKWLDRNVMEQLIDCAYGPISAQMILEQGPARLSVPITKTDPWNHQKLAYHFAVSILGLDRQKLGGGVMLGMDMGTGKSKVAIDIINNHTDVFRQILIVCPNTAMGVWDKQLSLHAKFNYTSSIPKRYTSTAKKVSNAQQGLAIAKVKKQIAITVINYEAVWRQAYSEFVKQASFDLMILDEVHRIKAAGSTVSRFFASIRAMCKFRIGLTGTPLPHSPLDAYGQYRYLDSGLFGTSYNEFRDRYATLGGPDRKFIVGYKNLEELSDEMFQITYRVMSEDVFPDMPEFIDEEIPVTLSASERKLYEEMEREFCVELEDETITAANAMVKMLRLQQITSGHLDGHTIGETKENSLYDFLQNFSEEEPIVIFARFTPDLQAIRRVAAKLKRDYYELSGKGDDLHAWQEAKKGGILGVQIQAGKESVDFTRGRYTIYYSMGTSLGDYDQSRKRMKRPGQTRTGVYYHLIVENSVDEKVMRALMQHKEIVEYVMSEYRAHKGEIE